MLFWEHWFGYGRDSHPAPWFPLSNVMQRSYFTTPGGISVTRTFTAVPFSEGMDDLLGTLESQRGFYLSSGYEYPGRYSRWDIASVCPPLEIVGRGRSLEFRPLNQRGAMLAQMLFPVLEEHPHWESIRFEAGGIHGILKPPPKIFPEEQRSKQPSVFSILRRLIEEFRVGDPVRDPAGSGDRHGNPRTFGERNGGWP